ncbi:phage tail tube protein [Liquorilactobacillus mali]|uniref:phage tail tube protein n=1 Tax=Liquorilactobacillus mali TaxID=1618 RepID=UPI00264E980F|nr:phage tail tube protein [Liquorilactobacillus mali]MDN7144445.1 phage tail tube protein [Liquorilactobacillus mali]
MLKVKNLIDLQRFATDASDGLAATGTKLEMSTDGTAFTKIAAIKTVPDIGADPETIDVTSLEDTKKKSVAGIENTQNLALACVYKGTNFTDLISKSGDGVQYHWKVTYPDGLTATFQGSFTLKLGNVAVNGAMDFTITVVVSDGPDFTAPSSGQ